MAVSLNFTELDVLEEVRQFLLFILPTGTEVIQGQANRVPEPLVNDFVVMTAMEMTRLATNVDGYDMTPGAEAMTTSESTQWGVQLDVHGDASAANASRIAAAWRSTWAAARLRGSIIAPLYANEPHQSAFNNGEDQYETRWIVTIYLQAKPVLTLPQDYATGLAIETIEADQ